MKTMYSVTLGDGNERTNERHGGSPALVFNANNRAQVLKDIIDIKKCKGVISCGFQHLCDEGHLLLWIPFNCHNHWWPQLSMAALKSLTSGNNKQAAIVERDLCLTVSPVLAALASLSGCLMCRLSQHTHTHTVRAVFLDVGSLRCMRLMLRLNIVVEKLEYLHFLLVNVDYQDDFRTHIILDTFTVSNVISSRSYTYFIIWLVAQTHCYVFHNFLPS